MAVVIKRRRFEDPVQIFDIEDQFARGRGVNGLHPRPFGPLTLYLVGQMFGGVRQDFAQPLELIVVRNPSGYLLFFGKAKQVAATRRRADAVVQRVFVATGTPATYVLRVESRYYAPLEREDIQMPMADRQQATFIDLTPGQAYPFPAGAL